MDKKPESDWHIGSHFGTSVAANHRVKHRNKSLDRQEGHIFPVYLSIKNPLLVDDQEAFDEAALQKYMQRVFRDNPSDERFDRDVMWKQGAYAAAIKAGYDGLVYKNGIEDRGKYSWVIFSPDQVRSAVSDINEDAKNDLSMASQAKEIAFSVGKLIYNGKKADHYIDISGYGEFLVYDGHSLGLDYSDVVVMLTCHRKDALGMSGAVYKFEPKLFDKYKTGIVIYGLDKVSESEARLLVGGTRFYTVMRHELIHLLDGVRTKDAITIKGGINSMDKKQYYNNPGEFNAYYHDLVSSLTDVINEIKKSPNDTGDLLT